MNIEARVTSLTKSNAGVSAKAFREKNVFYSLAGQIIFAINLMLPVTNNAYRRYFIVIKGEWKFDLKNCQAEEENLDENLGLKFTFVSLLWWNYFRIAPKFICGQYSYTELTMFSIIHSINVLGIMYCQGVAFLL